MAMKVMGGESGASETCPEISSALSALLLASCRDVYFPSGLEALLGSGLTFLLSRTEEAASAFSGGK